MRDLSLRLMLAAVGLALMGPASGGADVPLSTASATPDAPVVMVSPGRYSVSVMPSINNDMGNKMTQALSAIDGMDKVKAVADDSTIHFTVKDGAKVPLAAIQNAVAKTDSDAAISVPVLEHSLAPSPGL